MNWRFSGGEPSSERESELSRALKEQKAIESTIFEASDNNNLVNVKVSGTKQIVELNIQEALVDPDDIEMLQAVGWGLAMENASEELKAVADEVIGHVADDGIYHYCRECGLIWVRSKIITE